MDGLHRFTVVAIDPAGNRSATTMAMYTLDRVAPVPPTIVLSPTTPDRVTTPQWPLLLALAAWRAQTITYPELAAFAERDVDGGAQRHPVAGQGRIDHRELVGVLIGRIEESVRAFAVEVVTPNHAVAGSEPALHAKL
jgi:hypothetical protein